MFRSTKMTLFSGLSAFPLTPTDTHGRLMPDVMAQHLERLSLAGVDSVGLLGSTGSYAYLSPEERKRTVRVAADALGGRVPLIVGVGALRTDEAEALARDAAEAGADGLLLPPVSYQKLTEEEVYQHFKAVAAAGGLPLCIYNNPGTTNFIFSPDLIVRLSQVPHITGVKMPLPTNGDFAGELVNLRSRTPEGFAIGYSGDWGAKDSLLAGGDAWFSVVASLLPVPALRLARAAASEDEQKATRLDQAFSPLWALFKEFGSFRVMYALANLLDGNRIEPMRPVQPLAADVRQKVQAALDALHESIASIE
jgi:4-hydroxy-tetrahydrodipicolinate synthase